jgi:hypothetical protein
MKTLDFTKKVSLKGEMLKPKIHIDPKLSTPVVGASEFLNTIQIKFGKDIILYHYFKDAVDVEGDYFYDPGFVSVPGNFQFIDYSIDNLGKIQNLSHIKDRRSVNLFLPILYNLEKVKFNSNETITQELHACENWTFAENLKAGNFGKSREGCIPVSIISKKRPFLLFYYDRIKYKLPNLRLAKTIDETGLTNEDPIHNYYLILLPLSEKTFVYFAIIDNSEAEKILNVWINTFNDIKFDGIAVNSRMCYNDWGNQLGVFISDDMNTVVNQKLAE